MCVKFILLKFHLSVSKIFFVTTNPHPLCIGFRHANNKRQIVFHLFCNNSIKIFLFTFWNYIYLMVNWTRGHETYWISGFSEFCNIKMRLLLKYHKIRYNQFCVSVCTCFRWQPPLLFINSNNIVYHP